MRKGIQIKPTVPQKCIVCGVSYLSKTKKSKYCSIVCNNKVNKPLKGKGSRGGKYFPCSLCGKDVWVKPCHQKSINKFCSRRHQILYQKTKAFRMSCIICHKIFFTQPAQLRLRNRKTCSLKCRALNQTRIAEERNKNNPPTIGILNRRIRYSAKMERWRKSIFARDDYTCQMCGVRGTYLEADHIKPFAFFPHLRFELSNGRTLCRPCHNKTKISAKKMREKYKQ